jgi:hypothetical protein
MADIKNAYAASSNLTVTNLASLPSSSTFIAGWESGVIDNSSLKYTDYRITAKIRVAAAGLVAGEIRLYFVGALDDSTFVDVLDGTESTETLIDTEQRDAVFRMIAVTVTDTTASDDYYLSVESLEDVIGKIPEKFSLFIVHSTGANLAASGHQVTIKGSYVTVN